MPPSVWIPRLTASLSLGYSQWGLDDSVSSLPHVAPPLGVPDSGTQE